MRHFWWFSNFVVCWEKKIKMPFILRKWRQNRHHESLLIKSVDTQKKRVPRLSTHEKCPSWELAAKNPTELISVNYEVGPHRLGLERRLGCHIETINLTCHFPTWCLKNNTKSLTWINCDHGHIGHTHIYYKSYNFDLCCKMRLFWMIFIHCVIV